MFTRFSTHLTVESGEAAIEYVDGARTRTLSAGRHRVRRRALYRHVSVQEALLMVDTQEMPTAEQVPVKVSAAVRYRVADPVAYAERSASPEQFVYLATQVALREAVAGLRLEELARRTEAFPRERLREAAAAAGAEVGIEVLEVLLKDVVLPAELRRAAVALASAKAEGLAQLERARGEVAALRAAANGARLLAENPALAEMRMVGSVPAGTQLVLHVGREKGAATG